MQTIKGSKRTAKIKGGTGKLRGRHCVSVPVERAPRAKHAKKGAKLVPIEMHGCFTSLADAKKKAHALANRSR